MFDVRVPSCHRALDQRTQPRHGICVTLHLVRVLAQCDYINLGMTATGVLVRRLLRQRGWRVEWCPEDEEEVWSKTFPDGTKQHLSEPDAYFFEEEYARQFFRDAGIAMKPRGPKRPPESPPS